MERPTLYIFSKKQEMLLSISSYVRYAGFECRELKHGFDSQAHANTYFYLEEITSVLNKEPHETLLNTAAIIDITDINNDMSSSLNPIENSNDTGQIVSSLVLAYPEIYWIFLGDPFNAPDNNWAGEHFVDVTDMSRLIDLLKRHQNGYRPLFDPSGLRAWIKHNVLEIERKRGKKEPDAIEAILEKRLTQRSVAIDEEIPFTFLNGYVAYRAGYRCFMITSMSEMEKVLNPLSDFLVDEFTKHLTIEKLCKAIVDDNYDISISGFDNAIDWLNKILQIPNFYDILLAKKRKINLSEGIADVSNYGNRDFSNLSNNEKNLVQRLNRLLLEEIYPHETPKSRAIQLSIEDKDLKLSDMDNGTTEQLHDLARRTVCYPVLKTTYRLIVTGVAAETENGKFKIIEKPYAGIYDLKKHVDKLSGKGHLAGKITNDHVTTLPDDKKIPASHSATNKILLIADSLISRTKKILNDAKNCQECVLGAILSLEAKELLHGKSMTTALEAVALQYQMEVRAECGFLGVAHTMDTERRLKDISSEIDATINGTTLRKSAQSCDAQLGIINNIRLIFKEYEQFDEEEICLIKIRNLRLQLHEYSTAAASRHWVKNKLKRAYIFFIERYCNWLIATRSYLPRNTLISVIGWIIIFMFAYYVLTTPQQLKTGSPEFCKAEFKPPMTIGNLCKAINNDSCAIPKGHTMFWLNDLLKIPDFYDILCINKHEINTSKDVMDLVEATNRYRKNAKFASLSSKEQTDIKTLNRLLLEETYPQAAPKYRQDNNEASSWRHLVSCLEQSALTFIEMQDADIIEKSQRNRFFNEMLLFELVIAYGHLGIFITNLYQKLSRR